MTLAWPEDAFRSDALYGFEPPFLVAFRMFETMRDAQLGWLRAWCGLLGQVAPLPAEEVIDKTETDDE